jgi:5'-nucleotidase
VRILVTNDDGYAARGIGALVVALATWAEQAPAGEQREIIVVAPDTNYSGAAAAVGEVYARTGIDFQRVAIEGAEHVEAYALDASPALCALVGCLGGLGPRPDLIVSGINLGVNVGRSVLYSGTVGAVLSGGQLGLSGLAVSMQSTKGAPLDAAAAVAVSVLDELIGAPPATLLNLNVPALALHELKGIRRGRISRAGIVKETSALTGSSSGRELSVGASGSLELTLGSAVPELGDVSDEEPDDDGALIAAGYASLTALRGVHEDTDPGADDLLRSAIEAADRHLQMLR